jgi:hypothetical protein
MAVSAVGAVTGSVTNVYAALSPYLNGVVRTSDAAQAAQIDAAANARNAAATAAAIAARGEAAAAATAAPPFANPAITAIGVRIALGESLTPPSAVTPDALLGASALTNTAAANPFAVNPLVTSTATATTSTAAPLSAPAPPQQPSPADQVAFGDSGELIQSYGAVALLTSPLLLAASAFAQPVAPLIPPAAIVSPVGAPAKVV